MRAVVAFILGVAGFVLVALWSNFIVAAGVFLMLWGLKLEVD